MANTYTRDLWGMTGDTTNPTNQDTSAYTKFNLALMQMLKQQQSMGTQQFVNAEQQGIQEQSNRIMATPPQSLVGANPALQNQVRGAQASAMNPTIQGASKLGKTFSEQISGLGSAIEQARGIGALMQQEEQNETARQDAKRQNELNLMLNNPSGYLTYLNSLDPKAKKSKLDYLGINETFLSAYAPQAEEKEMTTAMIEAGGKNLLINSKTGDIIKDFGATPVSSSSTEIVEIGENKVLIDSKTGETIKNLGSIPLSATEKKQLQGEVSGGSTIINETDSIKEIDKLLTDKKGIAGATGTAPFGLGRVAILNRAEKQSFIGGVEKILSGLSLDALIKAKAAGATFGALSDAEMRILASSASKIGAWRVLDRNGNVTGYNVGEEAMKTELNNIKKLMEKAQNSGQTPSGIKFKIVQ